jgi:nucleoid-associated protein YgaU
MFSAMIRRLLLLLLGLVLAVGAGWALYERRLEQRADAPPSATSDAAPERTLGEGGDPEPSAGQASTAPPQASTSEGGEPDRDTAAAAGRPPTAQTSTSEAERLQGVEGLRPQAQESAQTRAAGPAPGQPAQTDEPAPGEQGETPAAPHEPESRTTAAAPAISAPAPAPPEASVTANVVAPPPSEDEPSSKARPDDGAAAERSAPPARAPQARTAAAPAAQRDAAAAARSGLPGAAGSTDAPAREPPPQPGNVEEAAPAVPPTSTGQIAATPRRETEPAADSATGPADAPVAGAAPAPREESDRTEESRPGTARVAETIRRAVAALFGAGTDEPAAGSEETETAAVPDLAPAGSAPDRERAAAGSEPGTAPSFDIVRVRPDGQAVIAGRAAPGAEVELRSGDRTIDRVRADQRGEWVALPPEPLGAGVQELSLATRVENQPAVASEEVVVVSVPEPRLAPPAPRAIAEPAAPQLAAADPTDEAFAVALPRKGAGKGRILQAPGRIGTDGALALVMLDYDEAGRIRLSGEADAGAALRIYVDNRPAGTAVVGPGGEWETVLEPTLRPGDYMLRLDQLDPSGKPDARLETPFTRVSHPPVEGDVLVDYVIVQPGNSLWRIARRVLGEGMRYVYLYEANDGQIRDPDLIYPGQVFEIPSGIGTGG